MNENRIGKDQYYLNIAKEVARRGTCLRRNYGAVIVKNDEIISTGYTGAPRGFDNCCDLGVCKREELNDMNYVVLFMQRQMQLFLLPEKI